MTLMLEDNVIRGVTTEEEFQDFLKDQREGLRGSGFWTKKDE